MERKTFLKSLLGLTTMATLGSFQRFTDSLEEQEEKMPVLFIGHGSPMNAIEENEFTKAWKNSVTTFATPQAILVISAHWETKGTFVTAMQQPKTIHDFGGFPKALFDVQYAAPGSEWLAKEVHDSVLSTPVMLDNEWGLDHGSWSILNQMYPDANVPVVQMSLDYTKDALYHYNLGKELQSLRKKGVLIIGSGNMVHNFQYGKFEQQGEVYFAHEWAITANLTFKKLIEANDFNALIDYQKYSKELQLSAPTPEHYLPMLYTLSLREKDEKITFFNDQVIMGAFSMTSFKISK
jgi:4,5-DOPA dioxygenase extradiol